MLPNGLTQIYKNIPQNITMGSNIWTEAPRWMQHNIEFFFDSFCSKERLFKIKKRREIEKALN